MKKFIYCFAILSIVFMGLNTNAQTSDSETNAKVSETNNVEVYYFHNTRRCATCNAVEDVTLKTLKEYYPEQMKAGSVSFTSLNLEEEDGEKVARKLKVSGQTLLIVIDGKKKDLTNDAFMYAKSKPEKLKKKIHEVIGTI